MCASVLMCMFLCAYDFYYNTQCNAMFLLNKAKVFFLNKPKIH